MNFVSWCKYVHLWCPMIPNKNNGRLIWVSSLLLPLACPKTWDVQSYFKDWHKILTIWWKKWFGSDFVQEWSSMYSIQSMLYNLLFTNNVWFRCSTYVLLACLLYVCIKYVTSLTQSLCIGNYPFKIYLSLN